MGNIWLNLISYSYPLEFLKLSLVIESKAPNIVWCFSMNVHVIFKIIIKVGEEEVCKKLLDFKISLEVIKYWNKIIHLDNLGMYEARGVPTKITVLRYILKNLVDKLSTEKWTRRQRRTENTEGIQRKPIDNLNRAITKKELYS